MDAKQALANFEKTCGAWCESLDRHDEEEFGKKPASGGWTLGQVTDHVTMASRAFLNGAEALTRGEGEERGGNVFAFLMCNVFNAFPPFRFKVPPDLPEDFGGLANPNQITKAEAVQRFEENRQRARDLCDPIAAVPPKLRGKHPAAGWVTATQWLQLNEMHMRHHLRQLRRLEKEIG